MGRTLPSITQAFLQEQASLSRFRRALRRQDQLAFDALFAAARSHLAASAYASHLLPFEVTLLAMLIEEHKAMLRLSQRIEALEIALTDEALAAGTPPSLPGADSNEAEA